VLCMWGEVVYRLKGGGGGLSHKYMFMPIRGEVIGEGLIRLE
jgi:hypothetical protein